MRARVIGLGQATAGDDGVGFAVIQSLREKALPRDVEILEVAEPSALVPLLETSSRIVLIDAVLAVPPGQVLELSPEELGGHGLSPFSTHGMDVAQAVQLARILSGNAISPSIRIVAITIAQPKPYRQGLSPLVAAAVPNAVERVLSLAGA